jgi:hypothetical protein
MPVGDLMTKEEKMPYVRFETQAVENKAASLDAGHFVGSDKDYAYITPPGSRDTRVFEVDEWFELMKGQVMAERLSPQWRQAYMEQYKKWKAGQETPPDGTPIKEWPVASPAQIKAMLSLNILTVEQMAELNDEGIRNLGMGATELRHKAKAWLQSSKDKGVVTQEVAKLKMENTALQTSVETLTKQVETLMAAMKINTTGVVAPASEGLQLDDEPPKRKR